MDGLRRRVSIAVAHLFQFKPKRGAALPANAVRRPGRLARVAVPAPAPRATPTLGPQLPAKEKIMDPSRFAHLNRPVASDELAERFEAIERQATELSARGPAAITRSWDAAMAPFVSVQPAGHQEISQTPFERSRESWDRVMESVTTGRPVRLPRVARTEAQKLHADWAGVMESVTTGRPVRLPRVARTASERIQAGWARAMAPFAQAATGGDKVA